MEADVDAVSIQTLDLLEDRLRRVEFAITGGISQSEHRGEGSVVERLQALETSLSTLATKSPTVSEIMHLRRTLSPSYRWGPYGLSML